MILRKIRYLNLMKKFNLMFLRIFFFFMKARKEFWNRRPKRKFSSIKFYLGSHLSQACKIVFKSSHLLFCFLRADHFVSFFLLSFSLFSFFTFQNETQSHGTAVNRAGGFDLFMSLLEGRIFFRFQRVWILIAPFYSLFSDFSYYNLYNIF